jgi:uncharacterized protein YndB with AHSA1/START domain
LNQAAPCERTENVVAVNKRRIQASRERVWQVLSDGWLYSNWVVGTSHMRAVEAAWPAAGARLFHASGAWPLATRDDSIVEDSVPNVRLALLARGRPFGEARVMLELDDDGPDCQVTMTETPVAGPGKWLHNPVTEALLLRRNVEALDRLAAICENRTEPSE